MNPREKKRHDPRGAVAAWFSLKLPAPALSGSGSKGMISGPVATPAAVCNPAGKGRFCQAQSASRKRKDRASSHRLICPSDAWDMGRWLKISR